MCKVCTRCTKSGIDHYKAIMEGCAKGMEIVGEKYEKKEMFIPEILSSAEAMYAAIDVLKPYLDVKKAEETGTVVIGVVEGDVHDIGKNIVRILLEGAGFKVIDLGRDVPLDQFIEKARSEKAHVIAASTLMTTTLLSIEDLMKLLKESGIREQVKVIIGGAATDSAFAENIGADAWGKDAAEGVRIISNLIKERRRGA